MVKPNRNPTDTGNNSDDSTDGFSSNSTDFSPDHSSSNEDETQEESEQEYGLPPQLPKEPCFASPPPLSYKLKTNLKNLGLAVSALIAFAKGLTPTDIVESKAPVVTPPPSYINFGSSGSEPGHQPFKSSLPSPPEDEDSLSR